VSEDAGIEPRTVVTTALDITCSNHSARSHPLIRGDLLEHAFALVVVWEKETRALVGGPVAPGVPGLWQAAPAHIPAQLDPQVIHESNNQQKGEGGGGPVAPGVPGLWQAAAAHIPAQLDPQVNR